MTEKTLEERAEAAYASWYLDKSDTRTDGAFIADFARAHTKRETAILRETQAQYERDFTKFAELERKRIVEIVDLRAENERLRESLRISDEQINGMNDAGLEHDADLATIRARLETLERLDREAAMHVESIICLRTKFTGDPPYVGWKGLGLALKETFDERDDLRARLERIEKAAKPFVMIAKNLLAGANVTIGLTDDDLKVLRAAMGGEG